jgi:hypothetical protein
MMLSSITVKIEFKFTNFPSFALLYRYLSGNLANVPTDAIIECNYPVLHACASISLTTVFQKPSCDRTMVFPFAEIVQNLPARK